MTTAIATGTPEDDRGGVLRANLPEQLDEEQRRAKYDEPLAAMIRRTGIRGWVHGSSQTGKGGGVASVTLEVHLENLRDAAFVAEHLVQLGAPRETVAELETDKACVELVLGDAAGR